MILHIPKLESGIIEGTLEEELEIIDLLDLIMQAVHRIGISLPRFQ